MDDRGLALATSYDPETLSVGVLGRPHGLRGEITLRPHNAAGRDLGHVSELILEREGAASSAREVRRIQSIRPGADGWLVKFAGVDTRSDVEPLTNVSVRVRRAELPPLGAGEFFVADTVGCEVFAEDGRRLGVVADVFWNGAHDVLLVKRDGNELLIPAIAEFVRAVDAPARRLTVAWDGEDEAARPADDGERDDE